MSYRTRIDPYLLMLKQSERKAFAYGFLSLFLLVMALVTAGSSSDVAGQFLLLLHQVQETVSIVLLCASGVSSLAAIWFIGKYIYFLKWPERFE